MACERICEGIDWICDQFVEAGHAFIHWIDGLSDFDCGFICGVGLCVLLWIGE